MIDLLVVLVILGLVLYLVQTLPIDSRIKTVIVVIATLLIIIWLLRAIGLVDVPLRLR